MISAHIQQCQNLHYSLLCNDNGEDEEQEWQFLQLVSTSSPPSLLALNRTRVPSLSPLFSWTKKFNSFNVFLNWKFTYFIIWEIIKKFPPILLILNLFPIILPVSILSSDAALVIIILLSSSFVSVFLHILSASASYSLLVPSPVLSVSCLLWTDLVEPVLSLSLLTILSLSHQS